MPRFPDATEYLREADSRDHGFRLLALAVLRRAALDRATDIDPFWFRFFPGGGNSAGVYRLRQALRTAIRAGRTPAASGLDGHDG